MVGPRSLPDHRPTPQRRIGLARSRMPSMQDPGAPAARRNPASARHADPEAALKYRSCKKGRYAPPVHVVKLTETQEITPYPWVHPDEERCATRCGAR
jgi:hypothetical protein